MFVSVASVAAVLSLSGSLAVESPVVPGAEGWKLRRSRVLGEVEFATLLRNSKLPSRHVLQLPSCHIFQGSGQCSVVSFHAYEHMGFLV